MSEYIKKEDVENIMLCSWGESALWKIRYLPAADVVKVVRCKDCKHKVVTESGEYNPEDIVCDYWQSDGLTENDFCSQGKE